MTTITAHDGVEIFYKDWGPAEAQPIVFHHGWPLSADDWDTQMGTSKNCSRCQSRSTLQ
jgi:non-heme chloroperoxidase